MASLTVGSFFQTRLIIGFNGSNNSTSLLFPTFRIPLRRLVCSQLVCVFGEHFLVGNQIILKLSLKAFHHFLDLFVSNFLIYRICGLLHHRAKEGDHQGKDDTFNKLTMNRYNFRSKFMLKQAMCVIAAISMTY